MIAQALVAVGIMAAVVVFPWIIGRLLYLYLGDKPSEVWASGALIIGTAFFLFVMSTFLWMSAGDILRWWGGAK